MFIAALASRLSSRRRRRERFVLRDIGVRLSGGSKKTPHLPLHNDAAADDADISTDGSGGTVATTTRPHCAADDDGAVRAKEELVALIAVATADSSCSRQKSSMPGECPGVRSLC